MVSAIVEGVGVVREMKARRVGGRVWQEETILSLKKYV